MADGEERICNDLQPLQEQLAVVKNNRKIAKWTLRELCLKAVVKNRNIFTEVGPTSAHLVENLPLVLRSDLAKMALRARKNEYSIDAFFLKDYLHDPLRLEGWCRFVARLLHKDISSLDLPACYIWDQRASINKLMEDIGNKCSGLRSIRAIFSISDENDDDPEQQSLWVEQVFFRVLPQLASLQVVHLYSGTSFSDSNLQQLANHLPNLVVLKVGDLYDEVSSTCFEALSKLPHLRKLMFDYDENWKIERKCLLKCAQFLPKLNIVGTDFGDFYASMFDDMDTDSYHKPLVQEFQPVPLGLEEVAFRGDVRPHKNCQLPELKRVVWLNPSGDVLGFLDRFLTITELGFYEADLYFVMQVLQAVGRRLKNLELESMPQELSLSAIIQFCPNLECLRISYCELESFEGWPIKEFWNFLETVEFKMGYEPLPRGFIAKLFGLPQLKKIKLSETYLSKEEVDELLDLVQQRRVLRNIVSLKWENYFHQDAMEPWMADEAHFNLLLDTIQVAYPKIDTIDPKKKRLEEVNELDLHEM